MAERTLKTDWKRIGRSGPTVDGRTINPQWLTDAAETYDKGKFTALIWPDHQRWLNYGSVESLKTEKNNDGGLDLLAKIAPNSWYLGTNKEGQRQFFSMEILPNFAQSGKAYLTGLAATDDPASLGTEQLQFTSAAGKAGVVRSDFEEISFTEAEAEQADEAETLSLFRRFVAKLTHSKISEEDEDMADKAALDAMQKRLDTLEAQFKKINKAGPGDDDGDGDNDEGGDAAITKLTKQVEDLTAKLEKFTTPPTDPSTGSGQAAKDEAAKATGEILAKLTQQVTGLETKLSAALKEQPGTNAGEHAGGEEDKEFSNCI